MQVKETTELKMLVGMAKDREEIKEIEAKEGTDSVPMPLVFKTLQNNKRPISRQKYVLCTNKYHPSPLRINAQKDLPVTSLMEIDS